MRIIDHRSYINIELEKFKLPFTLGAIFYTPKFIIHATCRFNFFLNFEQRYLNNDQAKSNKPFSFKFYRFVKFKQKKVHRIWLSSCRDIFAQSLKKIKTSIKTNYARFSFNFEQRYLSNYWAKFNELFFV